MLADGTQDDILRHAIVVRNFVQVSVADNASFKFIAQEKTKGVQAKVALWTAPPETTSPLLADVEHIDDEKVAQLLFEAARIKCFIRPRDSCLAMFGKVQSTGVYM